MVFAVKSRLALLVCMGLICNGAKEVSDEARVHVGGTRRTSSVVDWGGPDFARWVPFMPAMPFMPAIALVHAIQRACRRVARRWCFLGGVPFLVCACRWFAENDIPIPPATVLEAKLQPSHLFDGGVSPAQLDVLCGCKGHASGGASVESADKISCYVVEWPGVVPFSLHSRDPPYTKPETSALKAMIRVNGLAHDDCRTVGVVVLALCCCCTVGVVVLALCCCSGPRLGPEGGLCWTAPGRLADGAAHGP